MARINHSMIAKAIFSIVVVAAAASAGFAGLAGASRHPSNQNNGYGYNNTGALIQAAIDEFQRALGVATDKFNSDVAACVANATPPGDDEDELSNDFDRSTDSAVGNFSAKTANPTAYNNADKFNKHVDSESANLERNVNSATTKLTTKVDRVHPAQAGQRAFRACIKSAQHNYLNAIRQAQRNLKKAIHDILHP